MPAMNKEPLVGWCMHCGTLYTECFCLKRSYRSKTSSESATPNSNWTQLSFGWSNRKDGK